MIHLYIMCGLAFSGKSTLAREVEMHLDAKRIGFDDLWAQEDKNNSIPKDSEGWKFIRQVALKEVEKALKAGETMIYDDNNPSFEHRDEFRKVAEKLGVNSTVIYLNTPLEVIRKREEDNRKTNSRHEVKSVNFQKVAADLEVPMGKEQFLEFTPTTNLDKFLKKL